MLFHCAAFAICVTAQTIVVSPNPASRCNADGYARVRVQWSTGGPDAVVHIGDAAGTPFTGVSPASGAAETGDWVTDGMKFVLTDAAGRELASAAARVVCVAGAVPSSSYFPLAVGNQWVYRIDSRAVTADYVTWRVTGVEEIDGLMWFVMKPGPAEWLRQDEQGRIWTRTVLPAGVRQELWLDPVENRGKLIIQNFSTGGLQDRITYRTADAFSPESGTLERGFGLTGNSVTLNSGSSGGFVSSLKLLYVQINSGQTQPFSELKPAMELGVEAFEFDVSGQGATNCAIPCYFVACGIAGADPPGTYKPCFQARLRISGENRGPALWQLLDSAGRQVFERQLPVPEELEESILFRQIPLYGPGNVSFPAGEYVLRVQAGADGKRIMSAPIRIR